MHDSSAAPRPTRRSVAILRSLRPLLCAHRAHPVYHTALLALVNSSRPARLSYCAGCARLLSRGLPGAVLRSSRPSRCALPTRPVYHIAPLALVDSSCPPRLPYCAGSSPRHCSAPAMHNPPTDGPLTTSAAQTRGSRR
uniref:Uncharacterized protein n=1 Tax=Plectus sambesii TaxID=2011161 RepID=A0A914VZY6_9BILA